MAGPAQSPHDAAHDQAPSAADRRLLHLSTLNETARELGGLTSPQQIMDAFLLTAMGPLGASRGFVLVANRFTREVRLAQRGLEPAEAGALETDLDRVLAAAFPSSLPPTYGGEEELALADLAGGSPPPLPEDTRFLATWTIRGGYYGILGLSGILSHGSPAQEDREFLLSLAGALAGALKTALAAESIRRLNLELAHKNAELEEAVGQADAARSELARRAYHLKTLYDASRELSARNDLRSMAESFLLLSMGALSAPQGLVLVRDAQAPEPLLAMRGVDAPADAQLARDLAAAFAVGQANPNPMTAKVLTDERLLTGADLPFKAAALVLFALDEACQGLLALSAPLSGAAFGPDDRELLASHASGFLVFAGKARNFAAAQQANRDLARRNAELQRLLEEITQCRLDLEGEKRHKARIISFVERHTDRVRAASRLDFALIFALALLLGLIFNSSNPAGVDLVPAVWSRPLAEAIDPGQAALRREAGAVLVDARPAGLFTQKHIKEAVNLPASLFDFVYAMRFSSLPPDTEIIVYGRTASRLYDHQVALLLKDRGQANVKVLSGGLSAWADQGLPTEPQP